MEGRDGRDSSELVDYQIVKRMGEGAQGRIFLVREKWGTRQEWVMKMVTLPSKFPQPQQYEDAIREGLTMQYLHHPCVVSCKESFVHDQQTLCIVMEHCKGGDLCTRIRQQAETGESFLEDVILNWLVHTLLALEYLHKQRILHRDIKSENIFLHQSQTGKGPSTTAQLGDFGIARVLDSTDALASTFVGTPYYMSPELFKGRPYNYKTDIWALGCVLYELLCLRQPFRAKNFPDLATEVMRGVYPPVHPSYSRDVRNVVARMLTLNPDRRPLASEMLELPFLRTRAEAFVGAHAARAQHESRGPVASISYSSVYEEMDHSLQKQARRLHLLSEDASDSLSGSSTDHSPSPRRNNSLVDLYPQNEVQPPPTPSFASYTPGDRDSDWSSHSPSPSCEQRALSDPPPARNTKLYRPVPVRAVPVVLGNGGPYGEGPGPPFSDRGGRNLPSWSLLQRPPETSRGAESAPMPVWRGDLRTSVEEMSPGDSSPEDAQQASNRGMMADMDSRPNWVSTGMDYYNEGLTNPRGLKEIREARVKRRVVTAAYRARKSPRSPPQGPRIADFSLLLQLDEEDEERGIASPHVFHVDASSSSPELNEDGYEVIGTNAQEVWEPAPRAGHHGSVSDGHQLSGDDFGVRFRQPVASVSDNKQSAFSVYRRPVQNHYRHASEESVRSTARPLSVPPRQQRASSVSPGGVSMQRRSAPQTNEFLGMQFKSPSPPVGPPNKSVRPPVFVRSRRIGNLPSEPVSCEPIAIPPPLRARAYKVADPPLPGPSERVSSDGFSRASRAASPEEGKDSNGSSGGGSSNDSQGTRGSASSSGGVPGYAGSGGSSSSMSQFDSPGKGENIVRRIEGVEKVAVLRERPHLAEESGNTSGDYGCTKTRGVKEVGGGFVLQERREHSDSERSRARSEEQGEERRTRMGRGASHEPAGAQRAKGSCEPVVDRRAIGTQPFEAPPPRPGARQLVGRSRRQVNVPLSPDQTHSHATSRAEQNPRPVTKAPISENGPPANNRPLQQGVAYYSDGADESNGPTTSGHVAQDDRRARRAGPRSRSWQDHPLCTDRTIGRARFEYDLLHMHADASVRIQRRFSGSPTESSAYASQRGAFQGQLLPSPELRGLHLCGKEDSRRSEGVEWWRLPPINLPQDSERGALIRA